MTIPIIFTPADYYSDKDQCRIDRKRLFEDSTKAYLAAVAGDSSGICLRWPVSISALRNGQSMLVLKTLMAKIFFLKEIFTDKEDLK